MRKKPNNPRQISKVEYARLQADLEDLGDMGGIVHNERTDNLVGGNQRASVFDLLGKGAEIVITETYDPPTRTGTVARGYVVWRGEKYDYRKVSWDTETEDAACLVANLRGGTWDWDVLSGFDSDLLQGVGFDADLLNVWNDNGANLREMLAAKDGVNYDDVWRGMPEFEQDDCFGAFHSLKVHFPNEESIKLFSEIVGQNVTSKTVYIWYPKQEKENLKAYKVIDES